MQRCVGSAPDLFTLKSSQGLDPFAKLKLRLACANVLTRLQREKIKCLGKNTSNNHKHGPRYNGVYMAGRPRLFAEQFRHYDFMVVGTAETRMSHPGWCHVGSSLVSHGPRH
eukprot:662111-Pyramimonas_sp.AAC.1